MKSITQVSFVSALLLSGVAFSTYADTYTLTDLGTLGTRSWANGINNAGQVVGGSVVTPSGATHATLWNGTTLVDIDPIGVTYNNYNNGHLYGGSEARAINDLGQVVGHGTDLSSGHYQTLLWASSSTATNLNPGGSASGDQESMGYGINNSSSVVGQISTSRNTAYVPALWNGNTATELKGVGGNSLMGSSMGDVKANDINNSKQ